MIQQGRTKAKVLRTLNPGDVDPNSIERNDIYFIIDNVYDTYNIGALFRLADAIAARGVICCGQTASPPNNRIHKSAIGTENVIDWHYFEKTTDAVQFVKQMGYFVVAMELTDNAVMWNKANLSTPIALIFGCETEGVDKTALEMVDSVVKLPMCGFNESFNVFGTASVIAYKVLEYNAY